MGWIVWVAVGMGIADVVAYVAARMRGAPRKLWAFLPGGGLALLVWHEWTRGLWDETRVPTSVEMDGMI